MKPVYVVGTADTKGEELAYLADRIKAAGGSPLRVDVGTPLNRRQGDPRAAVYVSLGQAF